jgi:formylglycine-generating enzyme required for sulfatase activity
MENTGRETEKSDFELSIFSFETAFIKQNNPYHDATIIALETKQSSYFKEDVPKDLELEMVAIPKGKFVWFPKSSENVSSYEISSSHIEIEIESFYIGKYPITHKQWRVVSSLPKLNDYLLPSPDCYGQDNFPVTNISWYEAIEFCLRLSKITGKNYFLPSETQWEYACRAGINTDIDFHFAPSTVTRNNQNHTNSQN